MRVVSRFGRAAEFSVRDVSSVSRSLGWIVLYDREFRTLAKVDSSGQVKRISGVLWDKDVIYCLEIEESGEYPWGLFLKTTIRKLNWI